MPARAVFLIIFILSFTRSFSQEAAAVDSIKQVLASAKTDEEKVYWMDNLSRVLMNVDIEQSDSVGAELIRFAEETRDRRLMVKAYVSNGIRCGYFANRRDYLSQALAYYDKALAIARTNKFHDDVAAIYLRLAGLQLTIPDKEKALNYANQASSVISGFKNDSLKAECLNTFGNVYLSRNEKILALQNYLNALRIGEETKDHAVIRNSYTYLTRFYANIEDYDKAIDYAVAAYRELDFINEKNTPYQRVIDITGIGNLYAYKKNHDMAISYFERSLKMADSLKFFSLKIPAYVSLLNEYLRRDQPGNALAFFNSERGKGLQDFLTRFRMGAVADQAYGVIYTGLSKLDSATIYLEKARPFFDNSTNTANKMYFYGHLADLHEKKGEHRKAIDYFLKVKDMAEETGLLETARDAAKRLDTLYTKVGDYPAAHRFSSMYYKYKDSLEVLSKQKELAQVEADDEQQRLLRIEKERAEIKRRNHNIQYMSITLGIAALFIMLAVLGMFKVSASTIRFIGFFAFLMFFEFIFLVFKKNINSVTNGEPWKDLAFMIGLAAILVPLHHWLEKKVLKYLTSHNRLTAAGQQLKVKFFSRRNSGAPDS